ncbi:phage tail protein [Agromyces sp. Soil535]|uniref:phage tail protein n=1 Tax=Agromyces sp. Soil535 TaxID=1736390 RepID=UPI0006F45BC2|nr:phage tail protein [Agromyces sp. Soil535]KRE30017.1 hypothetical protein ASG80_19020 [Agromyces sp. Soil535]
MSLPPDSPRGDELVVTIDGVEIPGVIEVSGLSAADVAELKEQAANGKYVVRHLIGRAKSGEFTVTRGIVVRSATIGDWFLAALGRDVAAHPFEVSVMTRDESGNPRETFSFGKCHVRSIETDDATSTEAVVIAYEEADQS